MSIADIAVGRQRIAVEGLVIQASIGISPWEQVPGKRQRLQFDVAVYRDAFGQESDIADCYNYSALQRFLAAYADREHIDLLETILAEVLDFCFEDARVAAAEASVRKPDVFNGVGAPRVSAVVTREQWATQRAGQRARGAASAS